MDANKSCQKREANLYHGRILNLSKVIVSTYPDCKPCHDPKVNATTKVAIEMIKFGFYRNYTKVKEMIAKLKHPLQLLRILRALNRYTNNRYLSTKMFRVIDPLIVKFSLNEEETNAEIDEQFNKCTPSIASEVFHAEWLRRIHGLESDLV